jgi:hypothetical protein
MAGGKVMNLDHLAMLAKQAVQYRDERQSSIRGLTPEAAELHDACPPEVIAALVRVALAAADLRKVAVSEHGHDGDGYAPRPSCLPAHMALNRHRDAMDDLESVLA